MNELIKLEIQNAMERVAKYHQMALDGGEVEVAKWYELRYEQYKLQLDKLESPTKP